MELREIRLILGRHLGLMLAVFLAFVAIGLVVAYAPQQIYRAGTTIVLDLQPGVENAGNIQQISFQLPALVELAESRTLRSRAAERVPEQLQSPRPRIEFAVDVDADDSIFTVSLRGRRQ